TTDAPPSVRLKAVPVAVTGREQRLLCVLLVGGVRETEKKDAQALMADTQLDPDEPWMGEGVPPALAQPTRIDLPAAWPSQGSPTTSSQKPGVMSPSLRALWEVVASFGGQLEPLADGSVIVTFTATGVATDQAQRAARCALALRARLPRSPMALSTG